MAVVVHETLADFLSGLKANSMDPDETVWKLRLFVIHAGSKGTVTSEDQKSKLLLGYQTETGITVLACAELTSTNDLEERKQKLKFLLPGGVSVVGVSLYEAVETSDYATYEKYFESLEEQYVFLHLIGQGNRSTIQTAVLWSHDSTKTTADFNIVSHDLLSDFVIASCRGDIQVCVTLEAKGSWKHNLKAEIDRLANSIMSQRTVFHLQSSHELLSAAGCYGLPDDASCEYLASCVQEEEEGMKTRSKRKTKDVLCFDVYTNLSCHGDTDTVPTCSPIISYNTEPVKTVKLMLHIDAVSIFQNETLVLDMVGIMSEAVRNQLQAMKHCICDYSKVEKFITPEVCHFQPMDLPILLNVIYPLNVSDEQLENERKSLHQCLCLPEDRPLFRRANRYRFPVDRQDSGYLLNVHLSCPKSKVNEGKQYTVKGNYTYHHYMQDRFDDNKWGCAYRSLQTLVSWFRLQGYAEREIPTHKEIQQTLVDIGDKEAKFVGSRQWIGSMEVSFVLDTLLGVQSKILNVSSGGDLSSKGRELAQHFSTQGTPIMIGGGVLAHTILGVDYNEVTGDINFLILDPHYTGAEDLKTIIDKGWCGWKDGNFWDKNAHYNLCMPQRPKVI